MPKNVKLKVLYVAGPGDFNVQAGGEVQLTKTMEYLKKLGVTVDIFSPFKTKLANYDIVHIFGPSAFPMWSCLLAERAKKQGVKVAVSTIFWLTSYNNKALLSLVKSGVVSRLMFPIGKHIPLFGMTYLKSLFEMSDILLPNTHEEERMIRYLFNIKGNKFNIIPNGVDKEFRNGADSLFSKKYKVKDFILFVGRIERRKNVLQLIKAFKNSRINTKLIIIGARPDERYYELCKEAADSNVIFIDPIPHDSELLKSAYKACDTLVLPSNVETPGLVALEAGLAGAKIAITEIGGTKEYFANYATYINPFKFSSIKKAITDAHNLKKDNALSSIILKKYTWEAVAEKTLEAYKKIL